MIYRANLSALAFIQLVVLFFAFKPSSSVASGCGETTHQLTVSTLIFSTEQRNAFEEVAAKFSKECPNLEIMYTSSDDTGYKQMTDQWMSESTNVDLMVWLWPSSLKALAESGKVAPLTSLWSSTMMQEYPKHIRDLVTFNGEQYGIPLSTGFWGLYANSDILQQYDVGNVNTIDDLIAACNVLSEQRVTPIALGIKEQWPVLGLFDFLVLRLYGIELYQEILTGKVAFTDQRIVSVLQKWRELIDNRCFLEDASRYTQKDVLPLLYRKRAGFVLSGNFVISQIPESVKEHINFVPFPTARNDIAPVEIAPTDFIALRTNSKNKEAASFFLKFLIREDIQSLLNKKLKFLPVRPNALLSDDKLVQQGQENLKQASGVIQYSDRVMSKNYHEPLAAILVNFFSTRDVTQTTSELEGLRQRYMRKTVVK